MKSKRSESDSPTNKFLKRDDGVYEIVEDTGSPEKPKRKPHPIPEAQHSGRFRLVIIVGLVIILLVALGFSVGFIIRPHVVNDGTAVSVVVPAVTSTPTLISTPTPTPVPVKALAPLKVTNLIGHQLTGKGLDLHTEKIPIVSSAELDANGCANQVATTFSPSNPVYIVIQSVFRAGETIDVSLYDNTRTIALLRTAPLVIDVDHDNVCVSFKFEPTNQALNRGTYIADVNVNGSYFAGNVAFTVQ